MVIRVIAVYDLLDLIQTVGADLAGIRAKVEDDEIEDRESRKAADEPFARIEFRSLASYIEHREKPYAEEENVYEYDARRDEQEKYRKDPLHHWQGKEELVICIDYDEAE